jgi:hypothetical protein
MPVKVDQLNVNSLVIGNLAIKTNGLSIMDVSGA